MCVFMWSTSLCDFDFVACDVCMHMSYQFFAEMLIHLCFSKFLALRICYIFSKGHAIFF